MDNGNNQVISAEEVITKLKDDADFDKLRHKIIQKLKENEELRNSIISTVKQSATLNRAGAENLKPRELSDAIHEEIGGNVMCQISEALWGVIRSSDGMKSEISETVESVYNKLLNPKVQATSPPRDPMPIDKETSSHGSLEVSACALGGKPSFSEPKATPTVSACNNQQENTRYGENKEDTESVIPNDPICMEEMECHQKQHVSSPSDNDPYVPPGFGTFVNSEQQCDDDPDVPPGFG